MLSSKEEVAWHVRWENNLVEMLWVATSKWVKGTGGGRFDRRKDRHYRETESKLFAAREGGHEV